MQTRQNLSNKTNSSTPQNTNTMNDTEWLQNANEIIQVHSSTSENAFRTAQNIQEISNENTTRTSRTIPNATEQSLSTSVSSSSIQQTTANLMTTASNTMEHPSIVLRPTSNILLQPANTLVNLSNMIEPSANTTELTANTFRPVLNMTENPNNVLEQNFLRETASTLQIRYLSLLTAKTKRNNSIDYINNAFAQGQLPNNLRFTLQPYQWPTSFDENENRANHNKQTKILNKALRDIANNRLNILQISLQQITNEINLHREDDFLLNTITKERTITDGLKQYMSNLSNQYQTFAEDSYNNKNKKSNRFRNNNVDNNESISINSQLSNNSNNKNNNRNKKKKKKKKK